jgi:GT2 family glycosyltransferase
MRFTPYRPRPVARPDVDIIVPFVGSDEALARIVHMLTALGVQPGDTRTIADNRAGAPATGRRSGPVALLPAGDRRGSYHARNLAARAGCAPWLLFLDADVEPAPDLLERLFEPPPDAHAGVLAGAVHDQPPSPDASAATRYAWLRSSMSQRHTLAHGFAQTANCAVRRAAFEAVGGFADEARSGGDADLCLRLADAGWTLEERPAAGVVHQGRATVRGLVRQRARHGAGAAWVHRRHPGVLPPRRTPGLAWWSVRRAATGVRALARGERDEALLGLLDPPLVWAFELGRLLPNRPIQR